jgi:FAD synthetase
MKAISFNGGKESLIILHKFKHETNIFFRVNKDDDFPEINEYISFIGKLYNINILIFNDIKQAIEILKEKYNVNEVILGCRKTDPNCSELGLYQMTDSYLPSILRYHPLINWSYFDVWKYIEDNNLIVCSLYNKGYTSIGSKYNTFPNYTLFDLENKNYKHAKELEDASLERIGRVSIKNSNSYSKVIRGKGFGKKLGFPTANLNIDIEITDGVYYGYCNFYDSNIIYKMVMSKGVNPQFNDTSTEVHILHKFEDDFYDQLIKIQIKGFIRPMFRYNSLELLVSAINNDIEIAKFHLAKV